MSNPLTSVWCHWDDRSISGGSTSTQKIWDHFFQVLFNYHCHSPVISWPTSALAWLTQVSLLPTRPSLSFLFFPYLSPPPEILFITWTFHIELQAWLIVLVVSGFWAKLRLTRRQWKRRDIGERDSRQREREMNRKDNWRFQKSRLW